MQKGEPASSSPGSPYNAGDPDDVAEARRELAGRATPQQVAIARAMADQNFRRWLLKVLSQCHQFGTPFRTDSHATAFCCGEHNAGLIIVADIASAAPELYTMMLQENANG